MYGHPKTNLKLENLPNLKTSKATAKTDEEKFQWEITRSFGLPDERVGNQAKLKFEL